MRKRKIKRERVKEQTIKIQINEVNGKKEMCVKGVGSRKKKKEVEKMPKK